jgi:hypothetical protein
MKSIFLDQNKKPYFGFVILNNDNCICDNTLKSFKSKFWFYKLNIHYYLKDEYYGLFYIKSKHLSSDHYLYIKILKNEKSFTKWINKFKFYPSETDHGGWNKEKGILHLSDVAIKYLYKDLVKKFKQEANKTCNQMEKQFKKLMNKVENDLIRFKKEIDKC